MIGIHDLSYLRQLTPPRKLQTGKEYALDSPTKVPVPTPGVTKPIPAATLLSAMLRASTRVSDLIFSPGSLPHIEVSGKLVPVKITGLPPLTPEDTRRIGEELIGGNEQAMRALREQGSCDVSYSLPGECRFRVNVFVQRGSHAIVMRVVPKNIPTFAELKLPEQLRDIVNLKNGI